MANQRCFIGIETRASNQEPELLVGHWNRFHQEQIFKKIPNKKDSSVLAVYTDYESDFTGPYTFLIGCEVTSLDVVPEGLIGRVIPAAEYEVFVAKGSFPESIVSTWQKIWTSNVARAYTYDIEEYDANFDPQKECEVKVFIALKK